MIKLLLTVFVLLTSAPMLLIAEDISLEGVDRLLKTQQAKINTLENALDKMKSNQASLESRLSKVEATTNTQAQAIATVKNGLPKVRLTQYWNQTGNYSSCNSHCSSKGQRCVAGLGNGVATSNTFPCTESVNICLCYN